LQTFWKLKQHLGCFDTTANMAAPAFIVVAMMVILVTTKLAAHYSSWLL
jgi:hypothetical protein